MDKFRVCVYAIAKNEEQFVARWVASMGEADEIYVLDTGSTDGTVKALRENGVHVETEIISPWRFDVARNRAMMLLPEDCDICISTDLDEVFTPGWRAAVERAWTMGATRLRYRYVWNYHDDGREGTVFWPDKIHARHGYHWHGAVHEVLAPDAGFTERFATAEGFTLEHHADNTKPRSQYLPLLELAVAEDPTNDRNVHYLGREYLFHSRWEDCIRMLTQHLEMPQSHWDAERAASMRFIARAYDALGNTDAARSWRIRAIAEAPNLREGYVELAQQLYREQAWLPLATACEAALEIREHQQIYINESMAWGALPHDLAALAWYHLGNFARAVMHGEAALAHEPEDTRLANNLLFYRKGMAQ